MRKLIAATAVITALAVSAGTALAFQCPTLIKQGRDAAAKMDAKDKGRPCQTQDPQPPLRPGRPWRRLMCRER